MRATSSIFLDILARRRDDIIEYGTDWVIATAKDLQGKRPRDETRRLVERTVDVHMAVIVNDDHEPFHAFIEHVTSFRVSLEFRLSTLLRGFLTFKRGLSRVLDEERVHARDKLAIWATVDESYYEAIFKVSDIYGEKLVHTIKTRRDEVEVELGKKRQELDNTVDMVERLRAELLTLSLPILRIWAGVLLVPLIGEISPERAEHMREKLLDAVVKHRARVVLIDVTGLSVVDAHAAAVLGSIIRAVSLLGADMMIVGVRGEVARVFVHIGEVFPGTQTFATLDEGLRHALRLRRAA